MEKSANGTLREVRATHHSCQVSKAHSILHPWPTIHKAFVSCRSQRERAAYHISDPVYLPSILDAMRPPFSPFQPKSIGFIQVCLRYLHLVEYYNIVFNHPSHWSHHTSMPTMHGGGTGNKTKAALVALISRVTNAVTHFGPW